MNPKSKLPRTIWTRPSHFLAFGFGAGAMPVMPGTFGTLAAVPLYYVLAPLPLEYYAAVVSAMLLLGIWLCHVTARDLGVHDHSGIVWDEIVGYLLTMMASPPGWMWVAAGFVLFRLFDILKPWPIHLADRKVGGGFGIMLDDIIAGLYAWLAMQALVVVFI